MGTAAVAELSPDFSKAVASAHLRAAQKIASAHTYAPAFAAASTEVCRERANYPNNMLVRPLLLETPTLPPKCLTAVIREKDNPGGKRPSHIVETVGSKSELEERRPVHHSA